MSVRPATVRPVVTIPPRRGRFARFRRTAVIVCLSFALGALTDVALTWRLHEFDTGAAATASAQLDAAQSASPAATRAVGGDGHPAAIATGGSVGAGDATAILSKRNLLVPVDGVRRDTLRDTYQDARGGGSRSHEALDIMAPRGTPVRAVEDGTIAKLFTSKAGGLTVYQFDPSGTFCYYYAHLDRYGPELTEHRDVRKGDVLGYVGSTGNASPEAPHLHFAVFRLGAERLWWKGDPLDPFPLFTGHP
jgi:murein DD-endopeptidase MepM/ murein hydrolase activator NlpD